MIDDDADEVLPMRRNGNGDDRHDTPHDMPAPPSHPGVPDRTLIEMALARVEIVYEKVDAIDEIVREHATEISDLRSDIRDGFSSVHTAIAGLREVDRGLSKTLDLELTRLHGEAVATRRAHEEVAAHSRMQAEGMGTLLAELSAVRAELSAARRQVDDLESEVERTGEQHLDKVRRKAEELDRIQAEEWERKRELEATQRRHDLSIRAEARKQGLMLAAKVVGAIITVSGIAALIVEALK